MCCSTMLCLNTVAMAYDPPPPHVKPDAKRIMRASGPLPENKISHFSGRPVPRFVSLKHKKTNCRMGPSLAHDVVFEFRRKDLPVMIVAESRDKWRKIRDLNGDECWAFHTTLKNRSHALATRPTSIFSKRRFGSRLRGRVQPGALIQVRQVATGDDGRLWAKVRTTDTIAAVNGWTPASHLWGGDIEAERTKRQGTKAAIVAAHN